MMDPFHNPHSSSTLIDPHPFLILIFILLRFHETADEQRIACRIELNTPGDRGI